MELGGKEHYGWGYDRYIAADLHDLLSILVAKTIHWKKEPKFPHIERPKVKRLSEESKKPRSLSQIYSLFAAQAPVIK